MPEFAPDGYYDEPRPEVAACVPSHVRYVVDVGCGSGAFGRALKARRPHIQVRGIEPTAEQAEKAKLVLDDVHVGVAEEPFPTTWPKPDCFIFSDVLEHMLDPWKTIRTYRDQLQAGGVMVASIPNVAHRSVIEGLLKHRWDYADHGILDRTHLRFFTRETAIDMFEQAGLSIVHVGRTMEGLGQKPVGRFVRRLIDREDGRKRIYRGILSHVLDALTIQFLIVAK
jgi:SAM-dependent methyltransferase